MKLPDIIPVAVCVVLSLWLYWPVFQSWHGQWMKKDSEYSHAILVPFIAGFIVWLRRRQQLATPINPSALGYAFVIPSLIVYLVMSWAGANNAQGMFFPLLVWGTVLALLGRPIAMLVRFPAAYLFFMCTLPGDVLTKVSFRIQIISTIGATMLLNALGFQADRAGNFISLPNVEVEVAGACSGFRMLISLFAFAVLIAYLKEGPLWGRLSLVAVTLPLSVVLNSLRIMMVAMVGNYWGTEVMQEFHDYSGYIVLGMAFVILTLLARLFKCAKFNSTLIS